MGKSAMRNFSVSVHPRRVAKSLIQEMTDAERTEFNALPSLEIDDMEQV